MAATKTDLIAMAAAKCSPEVTQRVTAEVLEAVMDSIIEIVGTHGDELKLRGFGTFRIQTNAARERRHPGTGKLVMSPARSVPQFRPSEPFKEAAAQSARVLHSESA